MNFERGRPVWPAAVITSVVCTLAWLPRTLHAQFTGLDAVTRNAVWYVLEGKHEQAAELLQDQTDEPEHHYARALLALSRGEHAEARTSVRRAVQFGMAAERFIAGPRRLTRLLEQPDSFRRWLHEQAGGLVHGPMLGGVSDTSACFWVRTAAPSTVRISVDSVSTRAARLPREQTARSVTETDFTAIIRVDGLEPATEYTYRLWIDQHEVSRESFRFRTYPAADKAARFTVAFGGGAGFVPENERMWSTIRSHVPLAMLMLGDNVYIDLPQLTEFQRYCYYRRQSNKHWRQLVASTCMYAIYDDHDFGINDCAPGPLIEEPAWKRRVWKVFKQNWNNPGYGGGETQPGCWFDTTMGDVHFIFLDGRYYRSLDPPRSMLGEVQLRWLMKTLAESRGTFKVLISPVPWSVGTKPGPRAHDTWDGFVKERRRILAMLDRNQIEGVILLSADRHRSDARRTVRADAYDLYEFESSRLTNSHWHPLDKTPGWLLGYNQECSVGLLHFDTAKSDPEVTFEILNIDNESVGRMTIKRSQLGYDR